MGRPRRAEGRAREAKPEQASESHRHRFTTERVGRREGGPGGRRGPQTGRQGTGWGGRGSAGPFQ